MHPAELRERRAGIVARRSGEEQNDLAPDVGGAVIVPRGLPGNDPVPGKDRLSVRPAVARDAGRDELRVEPVFEILPRVPGREEVVLPLGDAGRERERLEVAGAIRDGAHVPLPGGSERLQPGFLERGGDVSGRFVRAVGAGRAPRESVGGEVFDALPDGSGVDLGPRCPGEQARANRQPERPSNRGGTRHRRILPSGDSAPSRVYFRKNEIPVPMSEPESISRGESVAPEPGRRGGGDRGRGRLLRRRETGPEPRRRAPERNRGLGADRDRDRRVSRARLPDVAGSLRRSVSRQRRHGRNRRHLDRHRDRKHPRSARWSRAHPPIRGRPGRFRPGDRRPAVHDSRGPRRDDALSDTRGDEPRGRRLRPLERRPAGSGARGGSGTLREPSSWRPT